jgi:hypothetical protein
MVLRNKFEFIKSQLRFNNLQIENILGVIIVRGAKIYASCLKIIILSEAEHQHLPSNSKYQDL